MNRFSTYANNCMIGSFVVLLLLLSSYSLGAQTGVKTLEGQITYQQVPVPNTIVIIQADAELNPGVFTYTIAYTDHSGLFNVKVPCIGGPVWRYRPRTILADGTLAISSVLISTACDLYHNFNQNINSPAIKMNLLDAGDTCPSMSVGQPVNVTNGNMWLKQNDYALPGIGEIISVNRTYNSLVQTSGIFGYGWTSSYDENITDLTNFAIQLNLGNGQVVHFVTNGNNIYTSAVANFYGQIVKNADGTYTLNFTDGRTHKFNANGKLLWQKDRKGNQTTLNYNENGYLIGVTDAFNRTVTIVQNTNGTIQQLGDSLGTIANYEYEPNTTLLKTVTYSDGFKYKFEYDATTVPGKIFLKTVKDADDNILETHEYDTSGRAYTSERHGGVGKYTLQFFSYYTIVTDALGRETKYFYNSQNGRNLIERTEGICSCGSTGSVITFYFYDSKLNLTRKLDALNRETTHTYDGNGNTLTTTNKIGTTVLGTETYTYNSFKQLLTRNDAMGGLTTYTYDANGNLKTMTDALGGLVTYNYPTTNNKGLPDSIKDARNKITKFKWFANSGLLEEIEDANGKKTNFTYDGRGRRKTVTNALNHTTSYNYFDDAQRKAETIFPNADKIIYKYNIRRLPESVTDERGKVTIYEFDAASRLKKITDPLSHAAETGYDLMSNVIWQKDTLGNQTDFIYDNFNRLKEIQYPPAETGVARLAEKYEYDAVGRIKKHYDTGNRLTEYGYNDANRTNTVTNAELETTTMKYNQRFQTIEVKDALNQIYNFTYDALGRQLSQTRAGGTMTYEYDAVGNRTKRTDYIGRETTYEYDALNRLKKINYLLANNPAPNLTATYNYDDISRLTSAANEAGTISFNYDNRNRLTSTTDVFGHLINYEYERTPTINQRRLKFDGAIYASYNFDDADRLTSLIDSTDNTTISFGYDVADRLTFKTLPNGITTTYEYDGMSRLKRLKDVSSTATLLNWQYAYNSANQIDYIDEQTHARHFSYDNVDRVTGMVNSQELLTNESYIYDNVGNRTASHRSASYAYQTGQFNRLASTANSNYTYDANGNMVKKSEGGKFLRFTWDYENRMTSASTRKETVRYSYDALGRRVQRYFKGGKENTKFLYDGQDVLVDDNGGTLTKYQNGLGVDDKLKVSLNGISKYFVTDHLGSTNGLTNASGNLTDSNSYDSFGNAANTNFPTRYQFTGREYDNFTGLHFYRARFYDANLGRFISEDPIGFTGGDVNLYGYVRNKPVNFFDPFGLDEYAMMERFANTKPDKRSLDEILDDAQMQLGALGLTPIVGEPADAIDGVISLMRGNYGDALLSGGSMFPFLGASAGITKLCKRVDNLPKGGVYRLIDPDTGDVVRTGRSKNLAKRRSDHARDPNLKDFAFDPVFRTDNYPEQRGLENFLYSQYPNAPFNFTPALSKRNKNREKYMDAAKNYLERQD